MRRLPAIVVLILAGLSTAPISALADGSTSTEEKAATIAGVLQREADTRGQNVNRRALLEEVLRSNPDLAAARWQAGYVQESDKWKTFENVSAESSDVPVLEEYRTIRQTAAQSVDCQLRLANWCKKSGLPEQERAHLTAALAFAEDRELPQVRARLGQKLVDGRWVTREELEQAERSSREMAQTMKVWSHRLQNIAERLAGNGRQRDLALAELQAINDVAVIPAVELVLTRAHEFAALKAVEWLADLDCSQSSLALARQAVFSTWPAVRKAAVDALKSRSWDEFVPPLLAMMHGRTEYSFRVFIGFRGELLYARLSSREMADHWQVWRYSRADHSTVTRGLDGTFSASLDQVLRANRWRHDALRRIEDDHYLRDKRLADLNETALNRRIGEVLAEATGKEPASDAETWWNRWVNHLDIAPREKRVVIVAEEASFIPRPRDFNAPSCLGAGTSVWTEKGPVGVEQVCIGDRVLAKDTETGELAYKPVVLTTRREAPRTVLLTIAGESIRLTGGHPVWVSGSGWTKARDLAAEQPLHTVTGTVAVDSVEPLGSGTVYNLVVADFHTYFFGESRILSHDTTIPKLTDVVVPGLPVAESEQP